jgi:hypothetical protein
MLPISASQIARIVGMSHCAQSFRSFVMKKRVENGLIKKCKCLEPEKKE